MHPLLTVLRSVSGLYGMDGSLGRNQTNGFQNGSGARVPCVVDVVVVVVVVVLVLVVVPVANVVGGADGMAGW